jgi:hypothetical protein
MSTGLSIATLRKAADRYQGMQKRVAAIREEAKEKVMVVVQTAEVNTAAFAFGVINGRWARPELVGVPVDALAGVALHAAGFIVDNDAGKHMHNLGDGALASYSASLGTGIGAKMRSEAGLLPANAP